MTSSGFETTELLTKAEMPSCKNGPCPNCIAVANIDEEISQAVGATLRRLIAKRCDLRSEQNRFHDPMHRLPVELRNHIFELVLPKQVQWGRMVERLSRIVMPSRLASICRNWRDVAWSNPSLWSTIHITLATRGPNPSRWIPFVQDWILRSRTLPLTLRIDASYASERVWGRILDVISPCSNRWQSLSLNVRRKLLSASHQSTFQFDRLRRLQIFAHGEVRPPVTFFDTTMSPEEIYICGLSFEELQISWNHLTSATVYVFCLEDVARLFQHASRMTYCHLIEPRPAAEDFSMPPIIHQSLTALRLGNVQLTVAAILFDSLTLPYLQEFHADDTDFLAPGYLPALVHRSSSPLTSIKLDALPTICHGLQPWPGIIDLLLSHVFSTNAITRLLLEEEYFPNLRYFTLRLQPFLFLWKHGFIRKLLDRKGPPPDSPSEGRLHKLLVVEEDRAAEFHDMWNSDVGEQLKAFNIRLREDGFEFL